MADNLDNAKTTPFFVCYTYTCIHANFNLSTNLYFQVTSTECNTYIQALLALNLTVLVW